MNDAPSHLLHVLLDSNLPTGGFIASSSLESYAKHGFFRAQTPSTSPGQSVVEFGRAEIENFARATCGVVNDAHGVVAEALRSEHQDTLGAQEALSALLHLDAHLESSTLNHVTRRASCAQGASMLTLYARGLAPTSGGKCEVVDSYRTAVRGGNARGHLAVAWGVVAAALGVSGGEWHWILTGEYGDFRHA